MASTQPPSASTTATGTLTFLFTDIEGSTKRWERHPEAMARAVARHDEIMRAAIAQHNGHVFKTVGDAFCAVFPSAEDALHASVAAQRAIAAEDWGEIGPIRVRMGIHTGEAEERDADYFGPTVNRVARIASAGHGGQTLLSAVTGDHAGERLPPEVRVRDLGKHRLKDLARPERILQLIGAGLPSEFPRLKTVPSPGPGIAAAVLSTLVPLVLFRLTNRSSSEEVGASMFSPLSLYTGLKGLVIELSTLNEYLLLAVGLLFLTIALWIGVARWRAARRENRLHRRDEPGRAARWMVNQRTVAFFAVLALLVLSAWAYQQYLWRVALPIPDDALGIAMTREASAAIVQEQLADSLYTQGQAEQVIMRELPVVFDARDTDRARELGERIGAHAVIIYRTDETPGGDRQYIAYVVFTSPAIGLSLAGSADDPSQSVAVKEGVPVPVLRTDSLEEMVNAASGIIAYDLDQPRRAVEYLQLAVPDDPTDGNSGIVNFYLGNAYNLDNQPERAVTAYEDAAAFYENRIADGEILGPQDQLILAKTYMERGRAATFPGDWEEAISWYERAVALRADVLARAEGLERPTDVHATYARLYALMADAYRFMERPEDQRSWVERSLKEIEALVGVAPPNDDYALVQQSASWAFTGNCTQARAVLDEALASDPGDVDALVNAGLIALLQDRPDLARQYWQRIVDADPNDVTARALIANSLVMSGLSESYVEPAYLIEAEEYYRQIIAVDPANVYAHQTLAEMATIRAQGLTLDSTALVGENELAVARSQHDWPLDPARRQAAAEIYGTAIDEYRLIASELDPDSPEAAVQVAEAYSARLQMLYTSLMAPLLMGSPNPEADALGEQILADAEQIHEWTGKVFDNPNATRLDKLRAWAVLLESLDREWGWYAFVEQDEERATDLEQENRAAVANALGFINEAELDSIDEIAPIRIVYFKAYFIASQLDQDAAKADALMSKIDELTAREQQGRREGIAHYETFCAEKREQVEAAALIERGDLEAARERYQAALEANPAHIASLQGYGRTLYLGGEIDAAIDAAADATRVAPDMPGPWVDLVVYQLANGDQSAAQDSLDQLLGVLARKPVQEQMRVLGELIDELRQLAEEQPEVAPEIATVTGPLAGHLDAIPAEELASYQRPALYTEIGELALVAGAPADAEPVLRQSLELDPHQPEAHARLVIALRAQDKDAAAEMERALAEVEDTYWSRVQGFENPDRLRSMMEDEVARYLEVFPEQEAAMAPFLSAIEQAGESRAEASTGVDGRVFTSAAHGYTLGWDDSWNVTDAATDPDTGIDSIQVDNGTSTVLLNTNLAADNPAGCLQAILGAIEGEEAWSTVVAARGPRGEQLSGANDRAAYATYIDAADSGAEREAVYYLECVDLPDADASVLALVIVPVEAYEEQRDAVNALLATFRTSTDDGAKPADPIELPEIDLDAR